MSKFLFVTFFCFSCVLVSYSSTKDSISSFYKNGEFITVCQSMVNVPEEVMNSVLDDYIYQSKYNFDELFTWALKGMKLRSEKDDLIVFNLKSNSFNPQSDIVTTYCEVCVPNVTKFDDIEIKSKMNKSVYKYGNTSLVIDIMYSDAFLKKSKGTFYVQPISTDKCSIKLETRIKFGWFFNLFITQFSYKYIMEWRFKKIFKNVSSEALLRNKLALSHNDIKISNN